MFIYVFFFLENALYKNFYVQYTVLVIFRLDRILHVYIIHDEL